MAAQAGDSGSDRSIPSESGEQARAPEQKPRLGTAAALLSRAASRVLGLVFIVYLARTVDSELFAAYSYLLLLVATLGTLSDAGVAVVAGRDVARGSESVATVYRAGTPVVIASGVLAAAGVVAAGLVDSGPGTGGGALVWASVFVAINLLFGFQAELIRASGRPMLEAVLQVIGAVLQFVLGVVVVSRGGGLAELFLILAAKELVLSLVAQVWLPLPSRGTAREGLRRHLFVRGLWLGAASTAIAIAIRAGQVALANAAGVAAIANYSAASRILDMAVLVCFTTGLGLSPWMAQRAHHDPHGFSGTLQRLLVLVTSGAVVISVLVALAMPWIFAVTFGGKFDGAVGAAQILTFSLPILATMFITWNALIALEAERVVTQASAAGAFVALLGCVAIATYPSEETAAVTTMIALLVVATGTAVPLSWRVRKARLSPRAPHPSEASARHPTPAEPQPARDGA